MFGWLMFRLLASLLVLGGVYFLRVEVQTPRVQSDVGLESG